MTHIFKSQSAKYGVKLLMLSWLLVAGVSSFMAQAAQDSQGKTLSTAEREMTALGGMQIWSAVRAGEAGYTTSTADEHGVLISTKGPSWMLFKEKWLSPIGGLAILGCLALVALVYFLMGQIKLSQPKTGRKIQRWSRMDRTLHWSMAFTFLTLTFSGLTLTYGKTVLKPIISTESWGLLVYLAKQFHNYLGPLFGILLVFVLVKWYRKSLMNKIDIEWLKKLGGMVGKHKGSHPSAGFSNAGEKLIFWMLISVGLVISVSGFMLDFPLFSIIRGDMAMANLIHFAGAVILISGFIFHIYIGLFGMESSLEAMTTGEVDETWAKEHHDLWYQEVKDLPENLLKGKR